MVWDLKKNALFNLIGGKIDIVQDFLYASDPYEGKYQLLINKCEDASLKHRKGFKAFIE